VNVTTSSWANWRALEFEVFWPADGPTNAQVLVHMKDWDYFWYQNLLPCYLNPGQNNHYRVPLAPGEESWKPVGHSGTWHLRTMAEPKEFAIRLFCPSAATPTCRIDRVFGVKRIDSAPPFIRNVRANTNEVPCYAKFELTFELPDRYPNPFDPDQVAVTAIIETPKGKSVMVDAFYAQDFYRRIDPAGERFSPQGPPCWRLRYAPLVPGVHKYRLSVRDRHGEAKWGPATVYWGLSSATPSPLWGDCRYDQSSASQVLRRPRDW
jgi:hypothetical protein